MSGWRVRAYELYERSALTLAGWRPPAPAARPGSTLLVPPASAGSVGDEAMISAALTHLGAIGAAPLGLLEGLGSTGWGPLCAAPRRVPVSHERLDRRWSTVGDLTRVIDRYERIILIGADVLDGYYAEKATARLLRILRLGVARGRHVSVAGFSVNQALPLGIASNLAALPPSIRLCARDVLSRERLERAIGRPVALVADLAFLLEPEPGAPEVAAACDWAAGERRAGRRLLGLNANSETVRAAENGESRLVDAYAAAFENLADEGAGISVVYVAHDGRASDLRLGEEVRERLPERLRARFHLQRPAPAAALKGLCGALDVALSGRMHMAIACLGQGVPVACQPYQGKFEGLFEHFGLEGHVLSPHRFLDAEGLTHDLRRLLERSGEIRARISARLPHVLALAAANFEPAPGEPR